MECYCIYISMEQKSFCLLVCLFCARCLPLIQLELHFFAPFTLLPFPLPPPPTSLFFFSWKWTRFCNSSDSPVDGAPGSRVFGEIKKKKQRKEKFDDESLDKSAASRCLPGFIVVPTEAPERKRPIESRGKKERNSCCFLCLFALLNVTMDQLKVFDSKTKKKKKMKNLIVTMRQILHVWFRVLLWTFGFSLCFALSLSGFFFPTPRGSSNLALRRTKASETNQVLQ